MCHCNDILDEKVFSAEWAQIEKLASSGIVPSTERIRNCLMGFCRDGSFDRCINKIICCIASVLRLEEERVNSDDSSLRRILALIESGQPANQLQSALSEP